MSSPFDRWNNAATMTAAKEPTLRERLEAALEHGGTWNLSLTGARGFRGVTLVALEGPLLWVSTGKGAFSVLAADVERIDVAR